MYFRHRSQSVKTFRKAGGDQSLNICLRIKCDMNDGSCCFICQVPYNLIHPFLILFQAKYKKRFSHIDKHLIPFLSNRSQINLLTRQLTKNADIHHKYCIIFCSCAYSSCNKYHFYLIFSIIVLFFVSHHFYNLVSSCISLSKSVHTCT